MKKRYFHGSMRRIWHFFPAILMASIIMTGVILILSLLYYYSTSPSGKEQKMVIGIVGQASDTYLGYGIDFLQDIDSTKYIFEMKQVKTEEEAKVLLFQDKIDAYAVVPEGWMDSVVEGYNDKPIRYVYAEGQKGLTSIMVEKGIDSASVLFTDSQTAVVAAQEIIREHKDHKDLDKLRDKYNIRILALAESRDDLSHLNLMGVSNGLTAMEGVALGVLLFAVLLTGLNNSPLFTGRNIALNRLLKARGVSPLQQVGMEFISYLILVLLYLFLIFGVLDVLGQMAKISGKLVTLFPHFAGFFDGGNLLLLYFELIPVWMLFAGLQFLLYEMTSGVVSSILLQFSVVSGMCYLSGYFYPKSFFPQALQALGSILPTGLAYQTSQSVLVTGGLNLGYSLLALLYLCLLLILAVLLRWNRLRRETT